MIRIYLDTNVMNELRTNQSEAIKSFKEFLLSNKHNFLFCYSTAHLNDLARDNSQEKFEDLDFIESLVDTHYLRLDQETSKYTFCYAVKPQDSFRYDTASTIPTSIENSIDFLINDVGLENPFLKNLLNTQILNVKQLIEKLPQEAQGMFNTMFPNEKNSPLDLMRGMKNLFADWLSKDSMGYRDVRRYIKTSMPFEKYNLDITQIRFNKDLAKTPLQKSFSEFVDYTLELQKNYNPTLYDKFICAYLSLNILGLDNERNQKAKFGNTMHDAQHAFFAGHCDIFVTQEKGMISKTKSLYSLYKTKTQVYDMDSFAAIVGSITKNYEYSTDVFWKLLEYDYKNGFVLDAISDLKSGDKYEVIKTNHLFLGYFNRLQKPILGNGDIVLTKNPKNYSYFTFHDELVGIVAKAVKLFGVDVFGMGLFGSEDIRVLKSGEKWSGRSWVFGDKGVWLSFLEGKIALVIYNYQNTSK